MLLVNLKLYQKFAAMLDMVRKIFCYIKMIEQINYVDIVEIFRTTDFSKLKFRFITAFLERYKMEVFKWLFPFKNRKFVVYS